MPTENPRVNVMLERPLYGVMHELAESEGLSMSALARELIREALELREDIALGSLADEREKTLNRNKTLSHKQVWG